TETNSPIVKIVGGTNKRGRVIGEPSLDRGQVVAEVNKFFGQKCPSRGAKAIDQGVDGIGGIGCAIGRNRDRRAFPILAFEVAAASSSNRRAYSDISRHIHL